MKKKILLIILVLLISGCKFYDEYKMPKEVYINLNDNIYEIYSKATINDLIKDTNAKILNKNENIKTNKIGTHKTTMKYKYKDRDYKYDIEYKIKDLSAPTILYAPSYRSSITGYNLSFCDITRYIDNYDRKPKCEVIGNYDYNKEGTYYLKYVFTDKYNNKAEKDFTYEVMDEDDNDYNNYNDDYEENIYFHDLIKNYKNKDTMIGIDVSSWQGDIDFDKVKKAGCEFVIIRAAVTVGEKQEIEEDLNFKEYYKNAKKAGLKIGTYVYTEAKTKDEVKTQAKFVKKLLKNYKFDFPVAYDFENWGEIMDYHINTHDLLTFVNEFKNTLERDVMIYGSMYYLDKVWEKDDYPIWLAHYTNKTDYSGDYILWQITNTGVIDGIYGNVDFDIYYKK